MSNKNLTATTSVTAITSPVKSVGASGDASNTVYTVPTTGDSAAKIDAMVLSNTTSSAITATVSAVAGSGSPGPSSRVGPAAFTVPANDAVTIDEVKGWYPQGTRIWVTPSATGLSAKLTGLEFA